MNKISEKQPEQKNKTRRGYGRKNKRKYENGFSRMQLSLLGTNANGLKNKLESLEIAIEHFKASIVTIQETKLRRAGSLKLKGYQIYETIRTGGVEGGGLLTAVDDNINSVLISGGNDENIEILVVQANVWDYNIRIINAYGPQEDDSPTKIINFWQEIEEAVLAAKDSNCFVLFQLDANAKIGMENLKNDPHNITANGKIMLDIIKRQNLIVANTLELCNGLITRERVTKAGIEKSIIDYVIICQELKNHLLEMTIDDNRTHVLTKYATTRGQERRVKSDHNILFSKFSFTFERKMKPIRKEFFKLKDLEGQKAFHAETSKSETLVSCFSPDRSFLHNANIFFKGFKGSIQKCFKKVRIKKGGNYGSTLINKSLNKIIKLRKELKIQLEKTKCSKEKENLERKIMEQDAFISENLATKNADVVKEYVKSVETDEGHFSQLKLWKLKQKLCPKIGDPPMAKKDENGTLITSPELLKSLYLRTYQSRLINRQMKRELFDVYFLKQKLWFSRLIELRKKRTKPWNRIDLWRTLKSLKNNKTSDPNGVINEIFKQECMGKDLEDALLKLLNGIKEEFLIPDFVLKQNITTIFKNKGSRQDMDNDRGIFILTVFKKILDKLIYDKKHKDIDKHMTDSNIGARKGRNVKNHLFMIHGIINSVIKGKEPCVDIQIYDIQKAFDSLWLEDCLIDAFDSLEEENKDEELALLYESNKRNLVAVKTAVGITERVNVPNIVQQGGTWGPLLCSNTIDTLGKKLLNRSEIPYLYKNTVKVLPLAMVDDVTAISRCGLQSLGLNAYLNTQIELKKLMFHVPDKNGKSKCHKMHIGAHSRACPVLKVHGTIMETVTEDEYLGDVISSDGKNKKNVEKRISKGIGIITQIMNLLSSVSFGQHYIEIALLLREAMFLNGILNNVEVWYGLTKSEIEEFENLDLSLLRKFLKAPVSTPKEALYLELGLIPIGILVKVRRINYLHYLISRKKSEMISQFFWTQWYNPTRDDWTESVKRDLNDFKIRLDEITNKSKYSVKKMVKKKAQEYALSRLNQKKDSHSKMGNVSYGELKMQEYFKQPGANINELRDTFKFRDKMLEFGQYYRGSAVFVSCPLCSTHIDEQDMLFQCPVMKSEVELHIDLNKIYTDNVDSKAIKEVSKVMNMRRKMVELAKK